MTFELTCVRGGEKTALSLRLLIDTIGGAAWLVLSLSTGGDINRLTEQSREMPDCFCCVLSWYLDPTADFVVNLGTHSKMVGIEFFWFLKSLISLLKDT